MRPVHLVLDTSAVLAYASGNTSVGETVLEVGDNGAAFTVPLTVLATAAARCDREWIDLLVTHPAFEPVTTDWSEWASLAAVVGLTGRLDTAEALLTALHHEGEILTADPAAYRGLGDDPPLIVI